MGQLTPSGRLISFDGKTVYGYARKPEFLSETTVLEYRLYAAEKSGDPDSVRRIMAPGSKQPSGQKMMNGASDWKYRQERLPMNLRSAVRTRWVVDKPPFQARAMVLAGENLFVSGPPDVLDEEEAFFNVTDAQVRAQLAEQSAVLKGKDGAVIWAVSAATGKKLAEYKLESLPVWDGMIAANGRLLMTTLKGDVISFTGTN